MQASTSPSCHEIVEPRAAFHALRAGRPMLICRDLGQSPGDLLVVSEYDEEDLSRTGTVAVFRIVWATRTCDGEGLLEALVPAGKVLLSLAPAHVVSPGPVSQQDSMLSAHRGQSESQEAVELPAVMSSRSPCQPPAPSSRMIDAARRESRRIRRLARQTGLDVRVLARMLFRELARNPKRTVGSNPEAVALAS